MRIGRIIAIVLIGVLLVLAACGAPAPTTPTPAPTIPALEPTTPTPAPPIPTPAPPTPTPAPPTPTPALPTPTPAPPTPTPAPPTTPPAVKGPYEVWVHFLEFRESILTVPVGTKVTWTNKDGEQHTVTSATGLFDVSLSFGDSFGYTFTERGTFEYYCNIHAGLMGAKVIVE